MALESWIETTIGEQATLQRGVDITKAEQRLGRVPVISSGGVSSYHDTAAVRGPGVVLGRKGVVGSVFYVEEDYWPHDTSLWVKDFHGNHPRFVYYFFKSVAPRLARLDVGSANPTLNRNHVHPIRTCWPPFRDQKAIADVLGALDDKIELNRRMNATLEAMARALFQSWFVDFDPVRAKLDGVPPPRLGADIAVLFPASFQELATRNVPKGWSVGEVGDVVTIGRAAINPGEFATEEFDHFSLPAFDNGRAPKIEFGSAIMSNKYVVTPNSVLLSKLNPHIPRIWLSDLHPSRRSVCSTEFIVASSKSHMSREYLFSLFTNPEFSRVYGTLVTGTTGSHQRIKPETMLAMRIVIPPPALILAFTNKVKPMIDQVNRNIEQSRTLAELRDTLLPKLLCGELRVDPVERMA